MGRVGGSASRRFFSRQGGATRTGEGGTPSASASSQPRPVDATRPGKNPLSDSDAPSDYNSNRRESVGNDAPLPEQSVEGKDLFQVAAQTALLEKIAQRISYLVHKNEQPSPTISRLGFIQLFAHMKHVLSAMEQKINSDP